MVRRRLVAIITAVVLGTVLVLGIIVGLGATAAAGRSSAVGADPNWRPQPSATPEAHLPKIEPAVPVPSRTPGSSGSSSAPSQSPSASQSPTQDPNVVATNLTAPTAIAVLPDLTALVGERTTGRILRVQPIAGKPVTTVRTLTGLNTDGGGGLLDLALSPSYAQDSLIFAYITTDTDNRVVNFTMTGPVVPVLTGIPKGPDGNAGRIAFAPDGTLLVATGQAGTTADPASLAGNLLRISDIGQPAGSPNPASPVYATGLHAPAGLCVSVPRPNSPASPIADVVFEVEPDAAGVGLVRQVGAAANLGGSAPLAKLPTRDTGPGGCAVIGSFLFVTSLDGQEVVSAQVSVDGSTVTVGQFTPLLTGTYGRLLTATASVDGSLWLATANQDGHGQPVPDDERIIHIRPDTAPATSPV
jgi:hypothetical protein